MSLRFFDLSACTLAVCATALALAVAPAAAEESKEPKPSIKLDARYAISMTGVGIGSATWAAEVGTDAYAAKVAGRASGLMAVIFSGEARIDVKGQVKPDGRPSPTNFVAEIEHDDEKSSFKMALADGEVASLDATQPRKSDQRVPVTAEHRKNVIDPVSAMLIPAAGTGPVVAKEACDRTLPVFDGRRRYDLALSFKRTDMVKPAKGYQGPVVVCAVALKPIAGHRADSATLKYLMGREIELTLAPIGTTRVLAPFRLSVSTLVGTLQIEAETFEVLPAGALKL